MANEITVLDGDGTDNNYNLLFLFPIATPKTAGGSNVVVTASSTLPALGAAILQQAEKDALNAGTSAFRLVSFKKDTSLTLQQLQTKVREIYAAQKTVFDAWYAQAYQHVGTRIDSV